MIRLASWTVGLSLFIITLTILLTSGFNKEISSKVFDFWGHITISETYFDNTYDPEPFSLDQATIDQIKNIKGELSLMVNNTMFTTPASEGVKSIYPVIQVPALLQREDVLEGVLLKGRNTEEEAKEFLNKYLVSGEVVARDSFRPLYLSETIANKFNLTSGNDIIVYFNIANKQIPRKFRVSGIYKTGLGEYDDKVAFCDVKDLQKILKWKDGEVSSYEVFVNNLDDIDVIDSYIYQEVLPANYYNNSVKKQYKAIFDWLALQDNNKYFVLALLLIVCLINMSTLLLILVMERSAFIGILKTMGAQGKTLRSVFLLNVMKVVLFAMVIGNLLALLFGWVQKKTGFIKLNEQDYYLDRAPIHFDWWTIIWINVVAFICIYLSLYIPALIINRMSIVKALRNNK